MRNPVKSSFKFDYSQNIVRIGTSIYSENIDVDINEKFKGSA